MMTLSKAMGLAVESLARLTGLPRGDILPIHGRTQCRRIGWIFFCEPRAHLRNGEVGPPIVGTRGPVVVTHGGVVHHLDAHEPLEKALSDFEWAQRRRLMLGSASTCGRTPR